MTYSQTWISSKKHSPNYRQNDMTTITSKDDVLTLLVHLGYLAYNIENKTVYIPNEEVRQEFVRATCIDEFLRIDELPSGRGYADVVFF